MMASTRHHLRLSWLFLITVSLIPLAPVHADKSDRDARRLFNEGVRAFEEGQLTEALDAFKRAYALRPSYRILYNIGQVQAELGYPHRAIESFEGYLYDGRNRVPQARRRAVEKDIELLRLVVGEITVEGPQGADVWIDGERKGYLPLSGAILLRAGRHRLMIRRGNTTPCEKDIQVKGGTEATVSCVDLNTPPPPQMDRAPDRTLAVTATPIPQENEGNFFLDTVAPWASAGLAVATLTAGIVFAGKASSINGDLGSSCTDGACPPQYEDDVNALPRLAGAADGMFIATAVLSAAAVTLFIKPWKDETPETGAGR